MSGRGGQSAPRPGLRRDRVLFHSITDPARPGGVEAVLEKVIADARARGQDAVEVRQAPKPGGDAEICPLFLRDDARRRLHLPSLGRVLRLLARHRPRAVNLHFVTSEALYFVLLRRVFGYRLVLSAHGSDIRLPDPKTAPLLPRLLAGADAVTVVSEEMRGRVLALPGIDPATVLLVPNGIDHRFWTPPTQDEARAEDRAEARAGNGAEDRAEARAGDLAEARAEARAEERSGPPEGPRIVAAGRLEPVKGFDLLIEAFAAIAPDHPGARLVLCGDGSERGALAAQAAARGVAERVEFAGFLGPEGLRAQYRAADLFVLSSRSEGFPIALLEAMATGLPFVAADVGGVREIATEGTGLCVPPEDAGALADGLRRMLPRCRTPEAQEAARSRARDFTLDRTLAGYRAAIDGTAPPGRGGAGG